MTLDPLALVAIGIVLVLVAVLNRRSGIRIRVTKSQGNVLGANQVHGNVTQSYHASGPVQPDDSSRIGVKDTLTWVIAIAGIIVAAVGVYFQAIHP